MLGQSILFQQLFESTSSTYTYILVDAKILEGIIIDPVFETVERDYKLLQELGVKLRYILDTHVHADHVTGSGALAKYTGAAIAMHTHSGVVGLNLPLNDGQELQCGSMLIRALATPGHTNSCMSYYIGNAVFTGDALLIRGNGRTDFQGGSAEALHDSIMKKLFTLPDDTIVFPGHDYMGFTSSTIGIEKKYNKRITAHTSKEQFTHIMSQLNLPLPKKIDVAVPANLCCGCAQN